MDANPIVLDDGRPVLGTIESIRGLNRQQIAGYYKRRYRPHAMVVTAAGNLDHRTVVRLVRKALERAETWRADSAPGAPRKAGNPPRAHSGVSVHRRATEQANLVLGVPGLVRGDDRRFAMGVLNAALGGGMSSRLFQEVREKRGLAYAVYSFASNYTDAGMMGVYAGCLPDKVDDVLAICRDELATVADSGLSEEELERGKGQLRGNMVLGMEDSGARMSRLGKA
jgi:predicted Zn-dependent peptidase